MLVSRLRYGKVYAHVTKPKQSEKEAFEEMDRLIESFLV